MQSDVLRPLPRLLIVSLSKDWVSIARLPKALRNVGFEVATLSHSDSFLAQTRFAKRTFVLPHGVPAFPYLVQAIDSYKPDLLIPGCEMAVRLLHEIVLAKPDASVTAEDSATVFALAQRSVGHRDSFRSTLSKHQNQGVAARLGLRTPRQTHIVGVEHATLVADSYGYPVVLKGEFGFAGNNVRICADSKEVMKAYNVLAPQGSARTQSIVVQQYIEGAISMQAAVAVDGVMLENVAALKVDNHPAATGPCSVARFYDDEYSKLCLSKLIGEYAFTGFCSADFAIENGTGATYLLEFNPRPVPLSSLGHLWGRDLCLALWRQLSGLAHKEQVRQVRHDTVALFPNEWARNPQSPYLHEAYHDVPWDDPSLLKTIINYCVR